MSKVSAGAADKRQAQSFGENIQQAALIVVGNVDSTPSLKVTQVLKGNSQAVGATIKFGINRFVAVYVPPPAAGTKRCAILFSSDSEANPSTNPIIEIYDRPEQIAALQTLIPIYAKKTEREKFIALCQLYTDEKSYSKVASNQELKALFQKEFLCAINTMREPANFEIVSRIYSSQDAASQLKLIDWIGNTGDERAIPILVSALNSSDRFVRSQAMTKLIYYYPGARGVDAALEHVANQGPDDLRPGAYNYISMRKHSADIAASGKHLPTPTAFQKAEVLDQSGKQKEAMALRLQVVLDPKNDGYSRRTTALKILDSVTAQERTQIRQSMLPLLKHDAIEGNYLEAAEAAEILRKLKHPDCLDSLIHLLDRREFLFIKANRLATMSVVDLGSTARHQATSHLLALIEDPKFADSSNQDNQQLLFLELAWIGQSNDFSLLNQKLESKPNLQRLCKNVYVLQGASDQADQGLFLTDAMKNNGPLLPHEVQDWIIYRLGDLKEHRAGELIIDHLRKHVYDSGYTADEALKSIGGTVIAKRLETIALSSTEQCQRNAVNIVCEIEQEKSLPFLRRILKAPNSPAKTDALIWIGRFGTPEDLPMLIGMSNYWTGDRLNHTWTMQALSGIRERFKYNVDGPIKK